MNKFSLTPVASLLSALALSSWISAPAHAVDECGAGPVVSCSGNRAPGGVTYNFSNDLTFQVPSSLQAGAGGINLNGSGGANLIMQVGAASITTTSGIRVALGTGNVDAQLGGALTAVQVYINTEGRIALDLKPTSPTATNRVSTSMVRIAGLTAETGQASSIFLGNGRGVNVMNLTMKPGGSWTITNGGVIGSAANNFRDAIVFSANGAGSVVIDNTLFQNHIRGNLNLSGHTGNFTLNNDNSYLEEVQSGWTAWGTSVFGSGQVDIHNGYRGTMSSVGVTTLDFSNSASSTFIHQGLLRIGASGQGAGNIQDLTFRELDSFQNSGVILMGVSSGAPLEADREAKSRLIFEGTDYVASGANWIEMAAALAADVQSDCSVVISADCILFVGGSTSGVTNLRLRDALPRIVHASFNDGIVLVEGASAAEHFVLDPASQYYVPHTSGGAALQKGLVTYHFEYDAADKQHKLVGALADEAVQASTYAATVQNIWRTTAETWFDRQETLRSDEGGGLNPHGVWGRLNVASGTRDLQRTLNVAGRDVEYNLGQDEQISHLALGVDFLRGASGNSAWNVGFTAGYVHALSKYDATQLESEIAGFATGIYGAWAGRALSVDTMINYNMLTQSIDGKNMGLGNYNKLHAEIESIGARVDAGWKFAVSPEFWMQPLISAAYVATKRDGIDLSEGGHALDFASSDSSRAGVGLRAALDTRLLGVKSQLMLTGRWWTELGAENESAAYITSGDSTVLMTDDFSGSFGEIITGLKLTSESGALSGHLNLKNKFGEDHSSTTAGLGVSYHW